MHILSLQYATIQSDIYIFHFHVYLHDDKSEKLIEWFVNPESNAVDVVGINE